MRYCSMKGCTSVHSMKNIVFHRAREEWQSLIIWKSDRGLEICSKHFEKKCMLPKIQKD